MVCTWEGIRQSVEQSSIQLFSGGECGPCGGGSIRNAGQHRLEDLVGRRAMHKPDVVRVILMLLHLLPQIVGHDFQRAVHQPYVAHVHGPDEPSKLSVRVPGSIKEKNPEGGTSAQTDV